MTADEILHQQEQLQTSLDALGVKQFVRMLSERSPGARISLDGSTTLTGRRSTSFLFTDAQGEEVRLTITTVVDGAQMRDVLVCGAAD